MLTDENNNNLAMTTNCFKIKLTHFSQTSTVFNGIDIIMVYETKIAFNDV